jgi:hypothetical protein
MAQTTGQLPAAEANTTGSSAIVDQILSQTSQATGDKSKAPTALETHHEVYLGNIIHDDLKGVKDPDDILRRALAEAAAQPPTPAPAKAAPAPQRTNVPEAPKAPVAPEVEEEPVAEEERDESSVQTEEETQTDETPTNETEEEELHLSPRQRLDARSTKDKVLQKRQAAAMTAWRLAGENGEEIDFAEAQSRADALLGIKGNGTKPKADPLPDLPEGVAPDVRAIMDRMEQLDVEIEQAIDEFDDEKGKKLMAEAKQLRKALPQIQERAYTARQQAEAAESERLSATLNEVKRLYPSVLKSNGEFDEGLPVYKRALELYHNSPEGSKFANPLNAWARACDDFDITVGSAPKTRPTPPKATNPPPPKGRPGSPVARTPQPISGNSATSPAAQATLNEEMILRALMGTSGFSTHVKGR